MSHAQTQLTHPRRAMSISQRMMCCVLASLEAGKKQNLMRVRGGIQRWAYSLLYPCKPSTLSFDKLLINCWFCQLKLWQTVAICLWQILSAADWLKKFRPLISSWLTSNENPVGSWKLRWRLRKWYNSIYLRLERSDLSWRGHYDKVTALFLHRWKVLFLVLVW